MTETEERETYKINLNDKMNVETALYVYKKQIEGENKQLLKTIKTNESVLKSLNNTGLKITGIFRHEKEPEIYDEKLKGVWEDIQR